MAPMGASDLDVSTASYPYAPIDAKLRGNVASSLTRAERRELASEFRGLLAMGKRNYDFDSWSGKPMADCYAPERPTDRWKHKCEIITGQGNGFYFFYDVSGGEAILQQVEVFLQASDPILLDELNPTLRHLFGRREMIVPKRPGYKTVGPIRHWNTGEQIADLFLDASQSPNGTVRFVWSRGALVRTAQASLPKTDN